MLSADDSNYTYITKMFSYLKNGDIHNTLRTLTGFSGLSQSNSDAIKYQALNHATAMRRNVMEGLPIFTNVRDLEAEIETRETNRVTSERLPPSVAASIPTASSQPSSVFTHNDDIRIDNAALALIMAKELTFLNRTIQMISLIASRYQEEQEDAEYGRRTGGGGGSSSMSGDDDDDSVDDDTNSYCYDNDEEAMTPRSISSGSSSLLCRSSSHEPQNDAHTSDKNQLVSTFLVGSGRLQQRFIHLCQLAGTSIVLVNAMTTMDCPHSEANSEKQHRAENLVLSDIYFELEKYDAEHRSPVVWAFLELRDISSSAWRIMSMLAFCNLIRLTQGTNFTIYTPEDSIFSQGRPVYYLKAHSVLEPETEEEVAPATEGGGGEEGEAAAAMDFDDDTVASVRVGRSSSIS
jgi:hypothetical protein